MGQATKILSNQSTQKLFKTQDIISQKYSDDNTYAVGQYCINDNVLYKFTSPKEPGAWDDTLVEATTVETELSTLNANLAPAILTKEDVFSEYSNVTDFSAIKYGKLIVINRFVISSQTVSANSETTVATLNNEFKINASNPVRFFWDVADEMITGKGFIDHVTGEIKIINQNNTDIQSALYAYMFSYIRSKS